MTAPIAGVVGDIPVRIGDIVTPSDTLTSITENAVLELNLNIPAERRGELQPGLEVEFMNIQGDLLTTGRISFVSPRVETNAQSILAKATFQNPNGRLSDGLNVRARVIWEESPGILIPTTAITRQAGQTFVYVAEPQPPAEGQTTTPQLVAQQTPVQIGDIQNNNYAVLEGLEVGDRVVVTGTLNLTTGAPIEPLKEEQNSNSPTPSNSNNSN